MNLIDEIEQALSDAVILMHPEHHHSDEVGEVRVRISSAGGSVPYFSRLLERVTEAKQPVDSTRLENLIKASREEQRENDRKQRTGEGGYSNKAFMAMVSEADLFMNSLMFQCDLVEKFDPFEDWSEGGSSKMWGHEDSDGSEWHIREERNGVFEIERCDSDVTQRVVYRGSISDRDFFLQLMKNCETPPDFVR